MDVEVPVTELAPYSMARKEYGDKIGLAPAYQIETMTLYPPLFKATMTFKGFAFDLAEQYHAEDTVALAGLDSLIFYVMMLCL